MEIYEILETLKLKPNRLFFKNVQKNITFQGTLTEYSNQENLTVKLSSNDPKYWTINKYQILADGGTCMYCFGCQLQQHDPEHAKAVFSFPDNYYLVQRRSSIRYKDAIPITISDSRLPDTDGIMLDISNNGLKAIFHELPNELFKVNDLISFVLVQLPNHALVATLKIRHMKRIEETKHVIISGIMEMVSESDKEKLRLMLEELDKKNS